MPAQPEDDEPPGGPQLLPRAGPEDRARWAFARRCGPYHKNQCGTGNAAGTQRALQQMRCLSLVCSTPGCAALVDYKAARRQAKQAGRERFETGDGCAARGCSADPRPARFARRQLAHADRLTEGERLLVRWPRDMSDRDVWVYPAGAAREAAEAARTALR